MTASEKYHAAILDTLRVYIGLKASCIGLCVACEIKDGHIETFAHRLASQAILRRLISGEVLTDAS